MFYLTFMLVSIKATKLLTKNAQFQFTDEMNFINNISKNEITQITTYCA